MWDRHAPNVTLVGVPDLLQRANDFIERNRTSSGTLIEIFACTQTIPNMGNAAAFVMFRSSTALACRRYHFC